MPALKRSDVRTCPDAFQAAIDASDVVGHWDWDAQSDRLSADALVALLFNVDPDVAAAGAPLAEFAAGIHVDDRARVTDLIQQCASRGTSYVAEYRVCSADGATRWVLARGRFHCDTVGRPLRGRGIIIDITQTRMGENAYVADAINPSDHPLERGADLCIAAHKALKEIEEPHLHKLMDMLLFEVGRTLARYESKERRKRMN